MQNNLDKCTQKLKKAETLLTVLFNNLTITNLIINYTDIYKEFNDFVNTTISKKNINEYFRENPFFNEEPIMKLILKCKNPTTIINLFTELISQHGFKVNEYYCHLCKKSQGLKTENQGPLFVVLVENSTQSISNIQVFDYLIDVAKYDLNQIFKLYVKEGCYPITFLTRYEPRQLLTNYFVNKGAQTILQMFI